MAEVTEVKVALDDIAKVIVKQRNALDGCVEQGQTVSVTLSGIPAEYADEIATINGYTPTGEFESLSKDELAKLTAEFLALKAVADTLAALTP